MADLNKADEDRLKALERVAFLGKILGIVLLAVLGTAITLGAIGYTNLVWNLGALTEAKTTQATQHATDIAHLEQSIRSLTERIDRMQKTYGDVTIEGKLISLTGGKVNISVGGKEAEYKLAADVRVWIDDKIGKVDDLKPLVGSTVYFHVSPDEPSTITAINAYSKTK
jgi:hypothetical protein